MVLLIGCGGCGRARACVLGAVCVAVQCVCEAVFFFTGVSGVG